MERDIRGGQVKEMITLKYENALCDKLIEKAIMCYSDGIGGLGFWFTGPNRHIQDSVDFAYFLYENTIPEDFFKALEPLGFIAVKMTDDESVGFLLFLFKPEDYESIYGEYELAGAVMR